MHKSIKITEVPYIYGTYKELMAFMEQLKDMGYSYIDLSKDKRENLVLRIDGNSKSLIQTNKTSFKNICLVEVNGNLYRYTGIEDMGIREFSIPGDYFSALAFMKANMNRFENKFTHSPIIY